MYEQLRVLDDASISADSLIGDIRPADFALVLNLDELDVSDEAEHFDHMPDDLVSWNRLDQLDLIVSLEIGHLVSHLANDLEVGGAEHELHVDINRDGYLAHCVLHQQNHASLQVSFEIDAIAMFDKERHLALIIRTLQVNMTGHKMCATAPRIVLKTLINLQSQVMQCKLER